ARRQAAAAQHVLDVALVELRNLVEDLVHHVCGEVVGADIDEGSLHGSADRRTAERRDHCFRHVIESRGPCPGTTRGKSAWTDSTRSRMRMPSRWSSSCSTARASKPSHQSFAPSESLTRMRRARRTSAVIAG